MPASLWLAGIFGFWGFLVKLPQNWNYIHVSGGNYADAMSVEYGTGISILIYFGNVHYANPHKGDLRKSDAEVFDPQIPLFRKESVLKISIEKQAADGTVECINGCDL